MDIKFMIDTLKEKDKQELKKIDETIQKKPLYCRQKALFLRRFILSLAKQYKHAHRKPRLNKEFLKDLDLDFFEHGKRIPSTPYRIKVHPGIRMPNAPTYLNLEPKMPSAPDFISIKSKIPEAPSKI